MPKYEVATNGRNYPVSEQDLRSLDLVATGPRSYHLLREGKSYDIELLDFQPGQKRLSLRVNGRDMDLTVSDETDLLVKQLGFSTTETNLSKDVIAPMPGLVLDIMVAPGDTVEAGTPLLILEAMKMENVLKSDGDGVIENITVTKGEAVEKRQLLIEIS